MAPFKSVCVCVCVRACVRACVCMRVLVRVCAFRLSDTAQITEPVPLGMFTADREYLRLLKRYHSYFLQLGNPCIDFPSMFIYGSTCQY